MKSFIRRLAFCLAMLSLGMNVSFAGTITGNDGNIIVDWTGKGTRHSTPEVGVYATNGAGNAANFIPFADNTNALGTSGNRWSDVEAVTETLGGNLTQTASAGVIPSTTSSIGQLTTAWLMAGSALTPASVGSVLCATAPVAGQGVSVWVCPAVLGLQTPVGIASVATSTGNIVSMYNSGYALVQSTGAITAGDWEVTSASGAGYVQSNNSSVSSNTIVGIALNSEAANTSGTTLIAVKL